jgi:hypothetical protein
MSDNAAEANPTRVSGGFFAIDRAAFRCAAVGGLNAAVPSGEALVLRDATTCSRSTAMARLFRRWRSHLLSRI